MAPESPIEIRPLAEADLPEVARLERACFSDPWSLASFREEIRHRDEGGFSRVLRADGRLGAYMVAWFVADEAHLANLAVAPESRRRGFGAALLEDLLREAAVRGSRVVWLEVRVGNLGAIRLYEKYRFQAVAVRKNYYIRDREDALVMMRVLEPEGGGHGILVQPQE